MICGATLCALLLLGAPQEPTDAQLITAVETATGDRYGPALNQAFARFLERVEGFELDRAEYLIRAMHLRDQGAWSAESYSMLLGRADRFEEARRVLDEQLERTPAGDGRNALLKTRALNTLGAGYVDRARRELGAALLQGSSDGAVVLGRLALSAGRFDRARVLSRPQLELDPAPAWALRSWGLSMLPLTEHSPPE